MSWTKEYTIWCDFEECVEWMFGEGRNVAQARSSVRRSGWRFSNDVDLCPRHATGASRTDPPAEEEA